MWQEKLHELPPGRRFAVGVLRIVVHVVRSFSQSLASLQAAGRMTPDLRLGQRVEVAAS